MHALAYEEARSLIMAVAVLIMSITGAIALIIIVIKGRPLVAQWKEWKVTLNPEKLTEFSTKMDEVVKSVNNKGPNELTLFQNVKVLNSQMQQMSMKQARMDAKLDYLITDLKQQVGLNVTPSPAKTRDSLHEEHQSRNP